VATETMARRWCESRTSSRFEFVIQGDSITGLFETLGVDLWACPRPAHDAYGAFFGGLALESAEYWRCFRRAGGLGGSFRGGAAIKTSRTRLTPFPGGGAPTRTTLKGL
jgi:hypothetical protein